MPAQSHPYWRDPDGAIHADCPDYDSPSPALELLGWMAKEPRYLGITSYCNLQSTIIVCTTSQRSTRSYNITTEVYGPPTTAWISAIAEAAKAVLDLEEEADG